jgi:hypothetical protein
MWDIYYDIGPEDYGSYAAFYPFTIADWIWLGPDVVREAAAEAAASGEQAGRWVEAPTQGVTAITVYDLPEVPEKVVPAAEREGKGEGKTEREGTHTGQTEREGSSAAAAARDGKAELEGHGVDEAGLNGRTQGVGRPKGETDGGRSSAVVGGRYGQTNDSVKTDDPCAVPAKQNATTEDGAGKVGAQARPSPSPREVMVEPPVRPRTTTEMKRKRQADDEGRAASSKQRRPPRSGTMDGLLDSV